MVMKRFGTLFIMGILLFACRQPEIDRFIDFDSFLPSAQSTKPVFTPDGSLNPEMLIPDSPNSSSASKVITASARDLISAISSNHLTQVSGTYTGHDLDGTPITLSGKLIYPAKGRIKNIILISHYAVCAEYEAPSESFPIEGIFAARGYALVIADYIGYGVTADRIHPFMHVESTARSVTDFALAAKPYLESVGRKPESDEVILLGYSQGASISMGVLDIIQKEYQSELPVKKVYLGGGPYDLEATCEIAINEDKTSIPCAIPMIVQGMNVGERLGLDLGHFFKPRLLDNYQEWINSKKYTIDQIKEQMGDAPLHKFITDACRDKNNPVTVMFYEALARNSTLNIKPKAPMLVYHSRNDDMIPFRNALEAEVAYKADNVTFDFGNYGDHFTAGVHFLRVVFFDL